MNIVRHLQFYSRGWVHCKMSHKKSPLGRKSKLLSVYRVGLATCIEMVGPIWQCCHFACLGGLPLLTLCPNGTVVAISPCFFISELCWIFPHGRNGTSGRCGNCSIIGAVPTAHSLSLSLPCAIPSRLHSWKPVNQLWSLAFFSQFFLQGYSTPLEY